MSATLREIGLGVKLSLEYPKAQVLNMYLNAVYYGHGYWGDVAAAHGYFGTAPNDLDWAQAAMLAGLPQAPSACDPLEHYTLAKKRSATFSTSSARGTTSPARKPTRRTSSRLDLK